VNITDMFLRMEVSGKQKKRLTCFRLPIVTKMPWICFRSRSRMWYMENRYFGNEQLGKQPEVWGIAKLHSRRTRYRPLGFPAGFWRSLAENPTVLHAWARPNSTSGGASSSGEGTLDECAARTDARI